MKYDEIGYWSEVKLSILREYANAYSHILAAQTSPHLEHVYIDAFAGSGVHLSRRSGEFISGSPLNALSVRPPFRKIHLIDIDGEKTDGLRTLVGDDPTVLVYEGDCNDILRSQIFPQCRFDQYRRALCVLDPYGLHLSWDVLQSAGKMQSIEIFLNFPVMDMNRNVLWRNSEGVSEDNLSRMDAFWGDRSWRQAAYPTTGNLFGYEEKAGNWEIAKAFQGRLKEQAGFAHVPDPIPMRNSKGAVVYYLFFASPKPVAANIVKEIFNKYREKGVA